MDASFTGLGAKWLNNVYVGAIPDAPLMDYNIVHCEMANNLGAFSTWGKHWAHQHIILHCDNEAVVCSLNLHWICDNFLMASARTLSSCSMVGYQSNLRSYLWQEKCIC